MDNTLYGFTTDPDNIDKICMWSEDINKCIEYAMKRTEDQFYIVEKKITYKIIKACKGE